MNLTRSPESFSENPDEINVYINDMTQTPGVQRNNMHDYYGDYSYFDPEVHDEFLRNIHQQTATFAVFLSIWTCIINGLLVCSCCRKTVIKYHGYYNQVVNLSVSHLLIGIFVIPLTIYHILNEWYLGPAMCKVYVMTDILLPFTSVTIIIILNLDRIISILHPRLYTWIFQKSLKGVVIVTPWLVSLLVVVPLWTSGTIPYQSRPGECIVLISKEAAILCPLLTFFFPMIVIICFTFKLILLRMQLLSPSTLTNDDGMSAKFNNGEESEFNETSDISMHISPQSQNIRIENSKQKKDDVVALCVVNTIFTIMWFPFQSVSFLLSFCHSQSCIPSIGLNQVVTWMGTASAGVVPLLWFIDSQVRIGFCSLFVKNRQTEAIESSNSEETYV